jgi:hypothetical protein
MLLVVRVIRYVLAYQLYRPAAQMATHGPSSSTEIRPKHEKPTIISSSLPQLASLCVWTRLPDVLFHYILGFIEIHIEPWPRTIVVPGATNPSSPPLFATLPAILHVCHQWCDWIQSPPSSSSLQLRIFGSFSSTQKSILDGYTRSLLTNVLPFFLPPQVRTSKSPTKRTTSSSTTNETTPTLTAKGGITSLTFVGPESILLPLLEMARHFPLRHITCRAISGLAYEIDHYHTRVLSFTSSSSAPNDSKEEELIVGALASRTNPIPSTTTPITTTMFNGMPLIWCRKCEKIRRTTLWYYLPQA